MKLYKVICKFWKSANFKSEPFQRKWNMGVLRQKVKGPLTIRVTRCHWTLPQCQDSNYTVILTFFFFANQVKQTIILGHWLASDLCHGCSDQGSRKDKRLLKLFLRQLKACFQNSVDNCKSLPFFYFLTFEKADCSIFALLVGWLVGRRHH